MSGFSGEPDNARQLHQKPDNDLGGAVICKPNPPIQPPMRGHRIENGPATTTPADEGCTILDAGDQCGRRLFRPHVANGRAFCGECCPKCAEEATLGAARGLGR
jgi:hypothetical protein